MLASRFLLCKTQQSGKKKNFERGGRELLRGEGFFFVYLSPSCEGEIQGSCVHTTGSQIVKKKEVQLKVGTKKKVTYVAPRKINIFRENGLH